MSNSPLPYPYSDLSLARRLERTEGAACAAFIESRARCAPEYGATWMELAGTYAMFDGPGSPMTQTFGLGVFDAVTSEVLDLIERFFAERGAAIAHEVCPLAPVDLLRLLCARGYQPIELSSVLYQPVLPPAEHPTPDAHWPLVREIARHEIEQWTGVSAEGWATEYPEAAHFIRALGSISATADGAHCLFAEREGQPIATATLILRGDVALLAGASTTPAGRRQGAQRALLHGRLRLAAEHGCTLAMMAAATGSSSQRNAERQGFRIAYSRTKWQRTLPLST